MRKRNTSSRGGGFAKATVGAVWKKGKAIPGQDPNVYRKDACRARMRRTSYGTHGDFGWEIDHIKPVSKGGTDVISNLQPLHWKNNAGKGDDYPKWSCALSGN